jgi:hypothetical protein
VRHPGESWFPTPISMFCLGWSRHDGWLRPILDEFQNELPVDDPDATAPSASQRGVTRIEIEGQP